MELHGKRALVVGLGESGLAMARWLARQGAAVRVADSRPRPPNAEALAAAMPDAELRSGPFTEKSFQAIDLIALSPGVPVQTPPVQDAIGRGIPVVSEIELFAWGARQRTPHARIVALSGSNGKTTTTALTTHLLNAAGVPAIACGNISPSALTALQDVEDGAAVPSAWVLEVSSFQLETTYSLDADAAVLLNISEDHLDRHPGMTEYTALKARIYQGRGVMVFNRDDARCQAMRQRGRKTLSFGLAPPPEAGAYGWRDGWLVRGNEPLIALAALKLAGQHNAANALAALALCEAIGVEPQSVLPALTEFKGLEHRVELVAEIGAVHFYDDSKGTNVGATLAAVQGLGRKLALILGGEGKAQDFTPLGPALAAHGRAVALIGRDARLIGEALGACGIPMRYCADLPAAVRWCAAMTQAGDAVLLSPACASFDMFRDYKHRAAVFIDAVRHLTQETA